MDTIRFGSMLLAMGISFQAAQAQVTEADRQKILGQAPDKATVAPKQARSLLIFQQTSGWTPPQRALVDTAMSILGRRTQAWKVALVTEDPAVMNPESLAKYDAILMNNCNELTLTEAQSRALQEFVKSGKGIIGIGSTISIRNWPEESEMFSGFCYGHPIKGNIPLVNEDPTHPLTRMFSPQGVSMDDTWYVIYSPTSFSREKVRVLLSWKWGPADGPLTDDYAYPWIKTGDYPIAYIRTYGKGRAYFNDFMHLKATPIFDKAVLQHLSDVTQWALGDLELEDRHTAPGPAHAPAPYTGKTRGDPATIPAIITRIKAGDPKAVLDLSKVMPDPRADAAFPFIADMLVATGSWYTSQRTAMMVARMGDYAKPLVPLIVARLDNPNPVLRTKLIYTLEEMGPSAAAAIPRLTAALADKDWIVRQGAAAALGNIGTAGLAVQVEMLKSGEWFTRFQGAQGLGKAGSATRSSSEALAALKAAVNDPDPEVVNAANRALVKIGEPTGLRPSQPFPAGTPALGPERTLRVGPVTRYSLPGDFQDRAKQVALFDLDGSLLGRAVLKRNVLDMREDFGLPPGNYILRVRPWAAE